MAAPNGRLRVVLVEDEADIAEIVAYNLQREGFHVEQYADGSRALDAIKRDPPDMVILDLMLPGTDGLEVCRQLKADSRCQSTPVMMVTAKGEESDIVLGLGIGADDYLVKPFRPKELVARVRALLRRSRRSQRSEPDERIEFGAIVIDAGRHEVSIDGQPSVFTATEFRLLHFLACHPGRVFTRDQLVARVIGDGAIVIDRNIDVHVRSVRKKLGTHRDCIETIRGVGYRFCDYEG